MSDIYIISGVRTAIGDFGGSLKGFAASDIGGQVAAEAIARAGLQPGDIGHVVMGQVFITGAADAYIARVVGLKAAIPVDVPALTVNRLCGSGVQAIISAAQMMKLGEATITLAGGAESMSNIPYHDHGVRWGKKMGDNLLVDALTRGLSDPIDGYHMGVTAENVAEKCGVTREQQDALAVEGHRRAARAIAEGRFEEQILPIEIKTRKGITLFDTDEHPRGDTTLETLAAMKAVFRKDGTVTAANASGINDGAAAVVLASSEAVESRGLKPMARIVAWGHAGVEPHLMGLGPVKAVPIALARAGLTLADIDVIEANEAFAAQAVAVAKELGFDPEKLNPNGSGVALGHPVGATGTILTVKAIYELRRIGGRYALITMCIGGGQGIAMIIERV
ncbi:MULTISPECIES: beta-ketothiolase BktB [unclassified Novosphingobium]|uniref:beta-ketothiolase BktB n=1 Tax=unclassified Novosphingobium TaxID=2644732 RepID=UPI000D3189CF|nr:MULTISPECIES: beta-ketothiolase BktB [unclassified Novosphingobium]PTR05813.1 acetyl-CoA acetyltransferase [Novosphingobium sp. GV055]PUA94371.1 acetyl-CoA acetyltransferase [Novosphingobium sp. GV061]PUB12677.1 acetyl-CoA acetyltransferase [Novosphingobium sp. GV079]PUB38042.1 acetyl-CoA acetyltransferase [Novosphingobium sp. GV027]